MIYTILLLGAIGRTGRLVIDEALAQGHQVVVLARQPDTLEPRAGLTVLAGNTTVGTGVQCALVGCSSIISTLNNNRTSDSPFANPVSAASFMTGVMRHVVATIKPQGVRHLAVVSAAGAKSAAAGIPLTLRLTSQLAFEPEVCERVYGTAGYENSRRPFAGLSFARDRLFRDGVAPQLMRTSEAAGGPQALITIAVEAT